jgi:hypothetical protein
MKLSHLLMILGASGLAVSVYALQKSHAANDADTQTTYYANGQVRSETTYSDGNREGTSTRYYSDGKKLAEGPVSQGRMEGEWTFWRQDGAIDKDRSGQYHAGTKQVSEGAADPSGKESP